MTCPTASRATAFKSGAVAVHRTSGQAVFEFMPGDRRVWFVNLTMYELKPTLDYLVSINGKNTP